MRHITLSLQPSNPAVSDTLCSIDWSRIDNAIAAPRFHDLQQFKIVLDPQFEITTETFEMAKDTVFKMMPVAAIRGVLAVEMVPWFIHGYGS
jgi:hypothetical protein